MMRPRNFRVRTEVVERGSVTNESKRKESLRLKGKWESVFSGRQMDNVLQILCRYIFSTSYVNVGIFPCVKTTSVNPDAHMAINADFDMLRQRKSPAKS